MCGLKTTQTCAPHFKSLKLLTFPATYVYETALFVKTNLHAFNKKLAYVKKTNAFSICKQTMRHKM